MNTPVVLLRGAPGVGKSTTATVLRERHRFAVVEVDDLRGELWHVSALGGLDEGDRYHVAITQAASVALALQSHGWNVVVVDTFNAHAVAAFAKALRGRAPIRPIALVIEPMELARRLVTRPEVPGVFRDVGASTRLNAELLEETDRIDITGMPTLVVAEQIQALAGGTTTC